MYHIVIQKQSRHIWMPRAVQLRTWATDVLIFNQVHHKSHAAAEVTIRIVTRAKMIALNAQYRQHPYVTNVLAFPLIMPDIPDHIPVLGDIAICADVVNNEAEVEKTLPILHWARIIVHGMLHLLGFDHETAKDAVIMENIEIKILKKLKINCNKPIYINPNHDIHLLNL